MNKKTVKRLREIGNSLPPVKEYYFKKIQVTGEDIFERIAKGEPLEGIKKEDIKPDEKYMTQEKLMRQINHVDRLKANYTSHGESGIQQYFAWLKEHIKKMALTDLEHKHLLDTIAFG